MPWNGHIKDTAVPKIKVIYSLDVDSVRASEELAPQWGVSKSEALRRAIHKELHRQPKRVDEALRALDELPASVRSKQIDLAKWEQDVRPERQSIGKRRGSSSR